MYNKINYRPQVLHIITGLSTGGAEKMLYNLLSKTTRDRFEPIVISLMNRGTLADRIEELGIQVHTLGMKRGMPTPPVIWRLIHTVQNLKPDLIQGWMYHGNIAAQVASALTAEKIPVVWGIHHSINALASEKKMTQAIIRLGAFTSRNVRRIVFVSKNSKLQHEKLGYCSENTCVIPNGFNTVLFQPSQSARLTVRTELSLPEQSFLIGLIARYHPMKDHANFLRAAALLLKKYPDIHFLLIGTDVNQENPELVQLIQALGISDRVHLLGERSDIPRLTAGLDIKTLASVYGEAFPLVVGEAMCCGVPCVVTDVGDSAWIVGNTGRVVPAKNSEALAKGWEELIELGLEGREALGKVARARIIESFSLDSIVAQYEELYEDVLAKN